MFIILGKKVLEEQQYETYFIVIKKINYIFITS